MRVAALTTSVSRNAGGLFAAMQGLCEHLNEQGAACSIMGFEDEFSAEDRRHWEPLEPVTVAASGPRAFRMSSRLGQELKAISPDVIHVHGLWQFPSILACRQHRRAGTPYVVSPHGMLDGWALRNSAFKKKLAALLFENRSLRLAACIHALGESEVRSIRAYGLSNPIAVIPNGVAIPTERDSKDAAPENLPWSETRLAGRQVLLYIGRLHEKKGLTNLIKAWATLSRKPALDDHAWGLVLAGWDQGGHRAGLEQLVAELGIGDTVWFAGPLFDEAKRQALRGASAFVLPSLSEGLPMVVLEAWSFGLPVLMTPQCNLPEGFAAGAAVNSDPDAESLREGLTALFGMSGADLRNMGERGLELVREKFNWNGIARSMLRVYEWCLHGGTAPECVKFP